jgi:tetraacyldisaccharide-1-P 4'-kinase
VADRVVFRDHHRFNEADLARVAGVVRETKAAGVLTTEKDAVRLLQFRPFPVPIAAVPLQLSFEEASSFDDWFDRRFQELVS